MYVLLRPIWISAKPLHALTSDFNMNKRQHWAPVKWKTTAVGLQILTAYMPSIRYLTGQLSILFHVLYVFNNVLNV